MEKGHSDSGSMMGSTFQFLPDGTYCSAGAGVGAISIDAGKWQYNSDKSAFNIESKPIKIDKTGFTATINQRSLTKLNGEKGQIIGDNFNFINLEKA